MFCGIELTWVAIRLGWSMNMLSITVLENANNIYIYIYIYIYIVRIFKARIKGKVEQSRERSSALPYTLV